MAKNLDEFLAEFKTLDVTIREQVIKDVEQELLDCVCDKKRFGGVGYPDIARLMFFYASSISDQRRNEKISKSTINAPRWNEVAEELTEFVCNLPNEIKTHCYAPEIKGPQVAIFATLAARKRGTYSEGLYLTYILFLIHILDKNVLKREYMRLMLTTDEKQIPKRLLSFFRSKFEIPGKKVEKNHATLGIKIDFEIRQDLYDELSNFVHKFIFGKDGCAHMIIYRPMRSNPTKLMKSFLAISPPERVPDDKNSFAFTHVYQPPRAGGIRRIGNGKLIPLEQGLYFIGGQKPEVEKHHIGENRTPFLSLKVICIRWEDIKTGYMVIPGIALSTNYTGKLISSRIALRFTPVTRASNLNLRPFDCNQIINNLNQDFIAEGEAMKSFEETIKSLEEDEKVKQYLRNKQNTARFNNSKTDSIELAEEILRFANNVPHNDGSWRIPDCYIREDGKRKDSLTDAVLMAAITDSLKSKSGSSYEKEGVVFDLWSHVRISPLQID